MTKVYIIGAGRAGSAAIEEAKRILELKPDVEIICVGSRDEIPFRDRLSSNPATIQEIIPLRPNIPLSEPVDYFPPKTKGHQRPYKFHR